MKPYVSIVGAAHALFGGLITMLGLLFVAVPVLMALYGVYECFYDIAYLIEGPEYWHYAFEQLISVLMLAGILLVPALFVLLSGGVELFAGVGILNRWPKGRLAGFVAAVPPMLTFGIFGILLGVGTFVVLMDEDVKREFAV